MGRDMEGYLNPSRDYLGIVCVCVCVLGVIRVCFSKSGMDIIVWNSNTEDLSSLTLKLPWKAC